MSLPDPLSLKNAANTAVSLTRRVVGPSGSTYVLTTSTPTFETAVQTSSTSSPKKGTKDASVRRVITFRITRTDTDGLPHGVSLQLSLVRSSDPDITDSDTNELVAFCKDFLVASSGDYLARMLRGET